MFDQKKYQTDCAQVRLGQEKIEEMIQMTEDMSKRSIRPLRVAIIAAAAVALLGCTALAASSPAVQQFIASFTSYSFTTQDGGQVELTALTTPDMSLEEVNGRTILTVDEKKYDVTDAFAREGKFVVESAEGVTITVTPDGMAAVKMPGSSSSWVFDLKEDGMDYNTVEWQGEISDEGGQIEITTEGAEGSYDLREAQGFCFGEDEDGNVILTDREGNPIESIETVTDGKTK